MRELIVMPFYVEGTVHPRTAGVDVVLGQLRDRRADVDGGTALLLRIVAIRHRLGGAKVQAGMMRVPAERHRPARERLHRDLAVDDVFLVRYASRGEFARVAGDRFPIFADPINHLCDAGRVTGDRFTLGEILHVLLGDVGAMPEIAEQSLGLVAVKSFETEEDSAVMRVETP